MSMASTTPTRAEMRKWAAGIPAPTYAIDDETAIKVTDETVEVVSEGTWKLLTPNADAA
jgi:dipeptidase E